ncbi:NACHT, LRR and PYD domains-containing 14-like, partial [Paramuricea clavata]
MIDTIKDYVSPKRFSILAYVCVIIHFHCGVILVAITTALRLGETEKFSCAVDTNFATHKTYAEKTCLSIYNNAYNSPVRFSAFVALNFGSAVVHYVLYPSGFHSQFTCVYSNEKQADPNITVECNYSAAQDKQNLRTFVFACNVIFAIITLAEVIYLIGYRFPCFNTRSNVAWSCDSQFITEYFLRKKYIPSKDDEFTGVLSSTDIYKEKVKNATLTTDINYGQNTSLDDMFINVVIRTGQASLTFAKNMKMHKIYDAYMDVPKDSMKEIKDLFYPKNDTGNKPPRTILALGRPGIGKTVLTRKIMRDWANGIDGFYHGKIAFFFKFRWFHFEKLQNLTLKEFLQFGTELNEHQFKSIFEEICNNPKHAIFIFDGLDEIGGNPEKFQDFLDQSRMSPDDLTFPMSAMFLFMKILSGNILSGATVLVTCRPTAVDVYSKLKFDRKVEIIGFTLDKIEQYVEQFCANYGRNDLKPFIWSHIKSSSELKKMCYIPVNCYIVCGSLANFLNDPANDNALPTTLTKLYQIAIAYFYENHDQSKSQECYQKLQELAFYGMRNGRLVFDGKLVNKQMKQSGLLHRLPIPFSQIETHVCFIHLTVQEFLAAKHIVETNEPEDIKKFISSHIAHGTWHLVLQFLAGLLGEKMEKSERTNEYDHYRSCVLAFAEHLSCKIQDEHVVCSLDPNQILLMKCLRETANEDIAKETAASSALKDVTSIQYFYGNLLCPNDFAAMVFVCKHLNCLTDLTLSAIKDLDCYLEVTKLLQERCIKTLCLCNSFAEWLQYVFTALMKAECHMNHEHSELTELDLTGNDISDSGVSHLAKFLRNGHGRYLKKLDLTRNSICLSNQQSCKLLDNEVCNQLTVLDLSKNFMTSVSDVHNLCETLIKKKFKVRKLYLGHCHLTGQHASWVANVLRYEHCEISDLSLSDNNIRDKGVSSLCSALRKKQCKLNVLNISRCLLTDECIPYLSKALGDEICRLTDLLLSGNKLSDEGVCQLCYVLVKEQCKLTVLDLSSCSLTIECVTSLFEALASGHCRLTCLKLNDNKIGDKGVAMLCCALRTEQCQLTLLNIFYCSLTDECMPSLCGALGDVRCKLSKLNVGYNAFTDKHLSLLSNSLKLKHCCLEDLKIRGCTGITDK